VRAVRTVRSRCTEWKIDPRKIGIIGSSAGGHLSAMLLTHFDSVPTTKKDSIDRASARPDFGVLCYPVISMGPLTHEGSRRNFLGDRPSQSLIDETSTEKHITNDTPPCFLWHTSEDKAVSVRNSLEFADALAEHGVPFEIHVYQNGRHGLGLGDTPPFAHALPWANDLLLWLRVQKVVK